MASSKTTTAPPVIHDLVERFEEHSEMYHQGDYNETQLRRDFLDPLLVTVVSPF